MAKKYDNFTVTKVKVTKTQGLEVEYSETLKDEVKECSAECKAPIHEDLSNVFQQLNMHLAKLCHQFTNAGELSDKVRCKGWSIGGEDEKEGFVLTGLRLLDNNRRMNVISPFLKFEEYGECKQLIEDSKLEILKYIFEAKHAPDPQGSLDLK